MRAIILKVRTMLEFGGSWSQKKLGVLAEYLRTYNTALKRQGLPRSPDMPSPFQ
jgi:hypothetical protein